MTVDLCSPLISKQSWMSLLLPVTVVSGLVLELPSRWLRANGWMRRTNCVPSRIFTSQKCRVALMEVSRLRVKDTPPGIKPRIAGGSWYRVEFHATIWCVHCNGTGGSNVKNELVGETSGVRQLESDDPSTLWIIVTSPLGLPVWMIVVRRSCERFG